MFKYLVNNIFECVPETVSRRHYNVTLFIEVIKITIYMDAIISNEKIGIHDLGRDKGGVCGKVCWGVDFKSAWAGPFICSALEHWCIWRASGMHLALGLWLCVIVLQYGLRDTSLTPLFPGLHIWTRAVLLFCGALQLAGKTFFLDFPPSMWSLFCWDILN